MRRERDGYPSYHGVLSVNDMVSELNLYVILSTAHLIDEVQINDCP